MLARSATPCPAAVAPTGEPPGFDYFRECPAWHPPKSADFCRLPAERCSAPLLFGTGISPVRARCKSAPTPIQLPRPATGARAGKFGERRTRAKPRSALDRENARNLDENADT